MTISNDILYIGVDDLTVDLFEGQYRVPGGMSYNSYVIPDEKIAVMDTVDKRFTSQWLANLEEALGGRMPDYLIVHHMEPDHSGSIKAFADKYPDAVIVASQMAFAMMNNYFGTDFADRRLVVKSGASLSLGKHEEIFIGASMIHWPEVLMNYDVTDKVLFSADAFGKFGTADLAEPWADEARRYFIGIVGKFGAQVQTLLKAAQDLDIRTICPLHGPVLTGDLSTYLALYDKWSSYEPEEEGVLIAYTSVYGNTKEAALLLADELKAKDVTVQVYDLARDDMALAVGDAFRFSKVVLATTTYNTGIFPFMHTFIEQLTERSFQKKTVALIENGSWAPKAAAVMKGLLENSKEIVFCENNVTIKGAVKEADIEKLKTLAEELAG